MLLKAGLPHVPSHRATATGRVWAVSVTWHLGCPLDQTPWLSSKRLTEVLVDNYLEHILHCDIHFQVLLTVGLEPVVGEAIIVRCCKEVSVHSVEE